MVVVDLKERICKALSLGPGPEKATNSYKLFSLRPKCIFCEHMQEKSQW